MYPFGIETISNIGGAAQSAYRLYKAARNATAKRQAARSRLQSFDVSLRAFDTLASSNAQLASQVDTARTAWDHVEHYLDCFENTDSSNETSRLRRICRNTKWAVAELDGKVDRMFDEVSISLQAITPALLVDLVLKMEVMHQSVESLKPPGDYGVFPRLAFTTLGKPLAFNVALEVDSQRSGYNLWPSLDLQRVQCIRPYTVPGFVKLWEILETPLVRFDEPYNHETYHGLFQQALDQKNAEITQLFANGKAHALDVDPAGMIWLQKLLSHPWDFGLRNAQWGLIEFVAAESSEIGPSEKLLWMCAKWIGEGPQMPMFRTLLKLGLDPGTLDAALLRQWPAMPDPGWVGKGITSDPFFIEWLRECLQKEPGFTDCNALSEAVLTGDDAEFAHVLELSKSQRLQGQSARDAFGQSATHLAVLSPERLKRLLEHSAADPNVVGPSSVSRFKIMEFEDLLLVKSLRQTHSAASIRYVQEIFPLQKQALSKI